jgi:hypothetical protein
MCRVKFQSCYCYYLMVVHCQKNPRSGLFSAFSSKKLNVNITFTVHLNFYNFSNYKKLIFFNNNSLHCSHALLKCKNYNTSSSTTVVDTPTNFNRFGILMLISMHGSSFVIMGSKKTCTVENS